MSDAAPKVETNKSTEIRNMLGKCCVLAYRSMFEGERDGNDLVGGSMSDANG